MALNFCPSCGTEQHVVSNFCSSCGLDFKKSSSSTNSGERSTTASNQSRPRKNRKRLRIVASLTATALLIVVGAGIAISAIRAESAKSEQAKLFGIKQREIGNFFFKSALSCGLSTGSMDGLAMEYNFINLDAKGEDDFWGASYEDITCMFGKLQVPSATRSRIESTRALDGTQSSQWEHPDGDWEITAFWIYHPDDGLDITFELKSPYLEGFNPVPTDET